MVPLGGPVSTVRRAFEEFLGVFHVAVGGWNREGLAQVKSTKAAGGGPARLDGVGDAPVSKR
jgi:hypothetical protein